MADAILALADGTIFRGTAIGAAGSSCGELVFNTSMTGYQEILTDPSYSGQIVTLTAAHVGNTGVNGLDVETPAGIQVAGLVVRDCPQLYSSWRGEKSLRQYLEEQHIVALADIDTRALTRQLRINGSQNACLMAGEIDEAEALARARRQPSMSGLDLASGAGRKRPEQWIEGSWQPGNNNYSINEYGEYHVVAYDYGIKSNILRLLVAHNCKVTVVPAHTSYEEALAYKPDGIFLSNGPGDPEPMAAAIATIKQFIASGIPLFGICLGHQLIGLASGAQTIKMKHGHHGANHPVQNLATGKVLISSQNHGFAVDESTLAENVRATHRSLFDGTLQGLEFTDRPVFSFQGHPEAAPGPQDAEGFFQHFIQLMQTA